MGVNFDKYPLRPPDNMNAIGVTKKDVKGCDKSTGKLEFSFAIKRDTLDMDYLKSLALLTSAPAYSARPLAWTRT